MMNEILGMKAPGKECQDKKCPFHGQLRVKEELLRGIITKMDINHTATMVWYRTHYVPKYERYEKRKSCLRVHNPPCLEIRIGDNVLVAKTRPLSKMKHHVIIGKLGGSKKEASKVVAKQQAMAEKRKETKEVENETN